MDEEEGEEKRNMKERVNEEEERMEIDELAEGI